MRADARRFGRRLRGAATLAGHPSPAVLRVSQAAPSRFGVSPSVGLLAVVLIWGLNFAVVKVPLEVMPPFVVNAIRFAISAAVLGALHVRASRAAGVHPASTFAAGWKTVVALGIVGHGVYQIGFILGIARMTAGGAALLVATSPLVTAALGHAIGVDRLRARGWLGVAISLVGVALVVLGRPGEVGGDLAGVAFLLAASLSWGVSTVVSRPVLERGATSLGLAFWGVLIALPLLVALSIPEMAATPWHEVDALDWLALVYSGSLSTGIAYWLWNRSVRSAGPARTAAFSNLVPFVGVGAGALLLGEPVALLQVLGGALVIAGLVVLRR